MTELELIFKNLQWDRKFTHTMPDPSSSKVVRVFREADAQKAKTYLTRNREETAALVRAAYLAGDSIGQFLLVTVEPWDSM